MCALTAAGWRSERPRVSAPARRVLSALALAWSVLVLVGAVAGSGLAFGQEDTTTQPDAPPPASDAYANQTDAEALATAQNEFDGLVDAPALTWPPAHARDEIEGYMANDAAVVSAGGGRHGILESTLPLRGKTPDGHGASIDLGLVDVGNSFAPKSSAVAVRIPDQSTGELRFPDQSFGVRLAGADEQDATVQSNTAFFANVINDGDLVLEPHAAGAELSVVLRSSDAPTAIPLSFDLTGGETLHQVGAGDGGPAPVGSVEVRNGDDAVGVAYPAVALDADGKNVPVHYRVDGSRLTMDVDTSGDPAWPVLVDPVIGVYDNNGTSTANPAGSTWPNWHPATFLDLPGTNPPTSSGYSYCNNQAANPSKKFYACQGTLNGSNVAGGPIYIKANASLANYANGDWAEWYKTARPGSYIYQFDAAAISTVTSAAVTGGNHGWFFMGVTPANPSDGWWETGRVIHDGTTDEGLAVTYSGTNLTNATRYVKVHDGQPTNATPIVPGNTAILRLQMSAAGAAGSPLPYIAIGGGATYSSETTPPTLTALAHSNPVPSDWVDSYSDTVSATADDTGLGMGILALSRSGTASGSKNACPLDAPPANTSGAGLANAYDNCPLHFDGSISYSAPEGVNTYVLAATDLVGNHNVAQDKAWPSPVKVDNSPPGPVTLSGPLWDDRNIAVEDGEQESGALDADEALTVNASDGSTSAPRSGVASIEMNVDGALKHPEDRYDVSCTSSGCPYDATHTFTFHPSEYAQEGDHTITVIVRDKLADPNSKIAGAHVTVKTFVVHVDRNETLTGYVTNTTASDPPDPDNPDPGSVPDLTATQIATTQSIVAAGAATQSSDLSHALGTSPYTIDEYGIVSDGDPDPITGQEHILGAIAMVKLTIPHDVNTDVPSYDVSYLTGDIVNYRAHFVAANVEDLAVEVDFSTGTIVNIEPGSQSESRTTAFDELPGYPTLPPNPPED